ncbi:sensor histidine kinase [Eubacterium sp.]|uniref:sensor histidine kinase n=1 Tax=Eubacterium sp. TaxID=142586 RepID=UPI002FCC568E
MVTAYLKSRKLAVLFFLLPILLFSLLFFLYGLPMEPLTYGLILYVLGALALAAWDGVRFYQAHHQLIQAQASIKDSLDALPSPKGQIAQDYQDLLVQLSLEKSRRISTADQQLSDIRDYYTLWAHQIKTPIAAMDLVLQTAGDAGNAAAMAELSEQLFRVAQYVDMVLQFIRTEGTTRDYVFTQTPIDPILRQTVRKFARSFIRRRITLSYEPLGATVLTDGKWLGVVLEQLLSNALKYVSPGGHITIAMATPGILTIADDGMGIDPADLPRVFERGFTGFNGREDKKSTGIGLYLSKRIMDQLGHGIRLESSPGKGTTLYLDLKKESTLYD